ncbi:hypothetical protein ACJ41O_000322 [Fusarium nematophilum]
MPAATDSDPPPKAPKKLVLCFDGTGNTFTGSNADTNVVKILRKLDRNHPDQYHYYQSKFPSSLSSVIAEMRSNVSMTIDQGFGTTFDAHVMAGYRFLMRYYESGAKIYIFGFSRGAFTAKFLARMVHTVGLLCKGNEEMVPFALRLYQRYLQGEIKDRMDAQNQPDCEPKPDDANDAAAGTDGELVPAETNINGDADGPPSDALLKGKGVVKQSYETEVARNEMTAFSQTFCRKELAKCGKTEKEVNVKVYFLGIWDCVNSVAVLERKTPVPVPVAGTANYVRHAVAVDERRVKFKPALLAQDIRASKHAHDDEDIKEVWFPGNHGDVGGGWPALDNNPLDSGKPEEMSFWQRVKNFWTTRGAPPPSKSLDDDRLQMSDIPLAWMIREVEDVGEKDEGAKVHWCKSLETFKKSINDKKKKEEQALNGFMHDCLAFGYGTGFFKVLMWKFMEWLPFISRWELDDATPDDKGWTKVYFPLNKGSARDIPRKAVLHASLLRRLEKDKGYWPTNNHGGNLLPCLRWKDKDGSEHVAKFKKHEELKDKVMVQVIDRDEDHQTYDIVPIVQ